MPLPTRKQSWESCSYIPCLVTEVTSFLLILCNRLLQSDFLKAKSVPDPTTPRLHHEVYQGISQQIGFTELPLISYFLWNKDSSLLPSDCQFLRESTSQFLLCFSLSWGDFPRYTAVGISGDFLLETDSSRSWVHLALGNVGVRNLILTSGGLENVGMPRPGGHGVGSLLSSHLDPTLINFSMKNCWKLGFSTLPSLPWSAEVLWIPGLYQDKDSGAPIAVTTKMLPHTPNIS